MKTVIISPHPDDEVLGAGGFLHRLKAEENELYWIIVTNVTNDSKWSAEFVRERKQQIKSVTESIGFERVFDLGFSPTELWNTDENALIGSIADCICEIQPHTVILPDRNDAHTDHKHVFDAGMACTKIFRYPYVKRILTMEILSETDFGNSYSVFAPNYFVDISSYLDKKIDTLSIYSTEIHPQPFPRSIAAVKALAVLRGGMAGCLYAEAFKIIKWIE